jgi:hypothetical protein
MHPIFVVWLLVSAPERQFRSSSGLATAGIEYIIDGAYIVFKKVMSSDTVMQDERMHDANASAFSSSNRYKTIWTSFHIHRMNDLSIGPILQKSATTTALPYLKTTNPDYLLATEMEYEEKQYFETMTPVPQEEDKGWTEVSPKHKNRKKTPTTSPTTTPQISQHPTSPDLTEHGDI